VIPQRAWAVEADIKRLAEVVSNAGSSAALVGAFREDIRQVRDQLGRIQDRQSAIANRVEEAVRERTTEDKREKHEFSTVSRQLDTLARGVEQYDNRMQAIEETVRRAEDDLSGANRGAGGRADS
jgi:chromosome segregation ATPase